MDLTEELIRTAAAEVAGAHAVEYQGQRLDFGPPFRRASMHDLVRDITGALSWALLLHLESIYKNPECLNVVYGCPC